MATPVTGLDLAAFFTTESTFDTSLAVSATDAVKVAEIKVAPEQEFLKSEEHAQSASLQTEIEGLRGASWEAQTYVSPAAAGTAPDIKDLLMASGFTETISGGTSAAYALNASNPSSLQVTKHTDNLMEVLNGAWVESVNVEVTGNQIPTVNFQGKAASYNHYFGDATTDSSTYSTSAVGVALAAADAYKIKAGATVAFGAEDNSGAGYRVTAVSQDGLTLTFTPGLDAGISASQAITPVVPAQTTGGTPSGGVGCGLTIGGTSVGFIDFKLNYQTGTVGLDQEATHNRANRIARGMRSVEGSIKFYFLDENSGYLGKAWTGATESISCRIGPDTAGSRCTIALPAARIAVAEVETPGNEVAMYEANFVARQSSSSDDELTITFH